MMQVPIVERTGRGRRGVLMLGVMLVVILIGFSLMVAWPSKPTQKRRSQEDNLKFKLTELRKALSTAINDEQSMSNEKRAITAMIYGTGNIGYIKDKSDYYQENDRFVYYLDSAEVAFLPDELVSVIDPKTELPYVAGATVPASWVGTRPRYVASEFSADEPLPINVVRKLTLERYLANEYGITDPEVGRISADMTPENVENILIRELIQRGYLRTNYQVPLLEGSLDETVDGNGKKTVSRKPKVAWRIAENLLTSSSFEEDYAANPIRIEDLKDTKDCRQYWFSKTEDYELIHATGTVEPPPYDDYVGQKDSHGRPGKYGSRVLMMKLRSN